MSKTETLGVIGSSLKRGKKWPFLVFPFLSLVILGLQGIVYPEAKGNCLHTT